jgi:short subunit dehydrogenase-like uncharacterized protein
VFFEASRDLDRVARMPGLLKRVLATGFAQRLIKNQIDKRLPPGPSAEQRASGRAVIVAEAWNATGKRVASRLLASTREGMPGR